VCNCPLSSLVGERPDRRWRRAVRRVWSGDRPSRPHRGQRRDLKPGVAAGGGRLLYLGPFGLLASTPGVLLDCLLCLLLLALIELFLLLGPRRLLGLLAAGLPRPVRACSSSIRRDASALVSCSSNGSLASSSRS
jgi:hypothetical protein